MTLAKHANGEELIVVRTTSEFAEFDSDFFLLFVILAEEAVAAVR